MNRKNFITGITSAAILSALPTIALENDGKNKQLSWFEGDRFIVNIKGIPMHCFGYIDIPTYNKKTKKWNDVELGLIINYPGFPTSDDHDGLVSTLKTTNNIQIKTLSPIGEIEDVYEIQTVDLIKSSMLVTPNLRQVGLSATFSIKSSQLK
jgi:hypothetical protein